MSYPKILNKNNEIIAHLNNLTECFIDEEINGAYTLSFVATVDDLKTQYLYDPDNIIEVNNDLFKPSIMDELHTDNNKLTISVKCEHISYNLLNTKFDTFSYPYATASLVMTECLKNTGFTFTGTDVILKTDINYLQESNAKQISMAIANNWKAELQYHRYNIHLWGKRGANRGVDFRFGKNIKGIKKTIDRTKVDADNKPTVSYDITVIELKHLAEYKDLEYFELGDMVRIIDNILDIEVYARVVKRRYNVLTQTNERIVLGNMLDDIRGSVAGIKKDVEDVKEVITGNKPDWDKINDITNNLGNVIASKLEGSLDLAITNILNSTGTFTQNNDNLYWQNQPTKENSTFASIWNANGLSFANNKKPDGDWDWQSVMNAEGLIATKILASAISTLSLEAVNALVTKLTAQTIEGLIINGGTINGGNLNINDTFIVNEDGNVTMSGDIVWSEANNPAKDIPSDEYITNITKNTVNTGYVNALGVTAKSVNTDWVYAGTVQANQLNVSNGRITSAQIDSLSANKIDVSQFKITSAQISSLNANQINVANGKITSAQIDSLKANQIDVSSGKITSAQIGNLDAGQITAGSFSADRISGGTIKGVTIDVSTDATVGGRLNLGTSTSTSEKGIHFNDSSRITSSARKMDIYSRNGIDIFANDAPLNIGTRGGSGQALNLTGHGVNIGAIGNLSGDITISTKTSNNKIIMQGVGTTFIEINNTGVDFMNRIPKRLIAPTVANDGSTSYPISFKEYGGKLQYRTGTGSWKVIG